MIKQLSFLKIKLFFGIILVILFLLISVEVLGMPWPISQFETQHPITATLGEFRRPWRFHAGIDIGCSAGTPVYPVVSGIVTEIKDRLPAGYSL